MASRNSADQNSYVNADDERNISSSHSSDQASDDDATQELDKFLTHLLDEDSDIDVENESHISASLTSRSDFDVIRSTENTGQLAKLISDGHLTGQASAWLMSNAKRILEWIRRPDVWKKIKIAAVSGITFGGVLAIIASLGFGSAGIVGGSLAAGFQSIVYGGLTPAGGLFATLQSMGMLGTLLPVGAGIAAAAGAIGGWIAWYRGRRTEESKEHDE
ncbi:hypothetical protein ACLMJK_007470 [Lecanora helva]